MSAVKIKTKIKDGTIRDKRLAEWNGKDVEIIISEIKKEKKRDWRNFGKANLGGKYDNNNIRDLAHEENSN